MEQTRYRPTPPSEVFAVRVERAVKHLSRHIIVYEYSYSVRFELNV
ncbi:MAG: hypothetical protein LBU98_06385 [Alistipes sp.]|jgi:hypothetical protein|nr:hypothetical protein [Alistipes sp.]